MLTREELEVLLSLGNETRALELKSPGNLADTRIRAKVARAAMAMGNLRDGGTVCLGIDGKDSAAVLPGLSAQQITDWSNYDDVADALARYSDPPVNFAVRALTLSSGADVVLLDVQEFDDVPHVCKRNYPGELQEGFTYVRPRGKPRSVTVPTSTDMRDLLDLAISKGVRRFVRQLTDTGLVTVHGMSAAQVRPFEDEAQLFWAEPSEALQDLNAKAMFDVAIRPEPYDAALLTPDKLLSFITSQAVRLRGWPVPFVSSAAALRHGTWVGQDEGIVRTPHHEAWRFSTSGQFAQRRALVTELVHTPQLLGDAPGATGYVAIWDVLFYLTELAELGARIATATGCESITFQVRLDNIGGRQLISGEWGRELHDQYVIATNSIDGGLTIDTPTLLNGPRAVGREMAQRLFKQFGLSLPDQVLDDQVAETLRPD